MAAAALLVGNVCVSQARADLVCKALDVENPGQIVVSSEATGVDPACFNLKVKTGQNIAVRIVDSPGVDLSLGYKRKPDDFDFTGVVDDVKHYEFVAERGLSYTLLFGKRDYEMGQTYSIVFSIKSN